MRWILGRDIQSPCFEILCINAQPDTALPASQLWESWKRISALVRPDLIRGI
jgi:hypothetical protein|tara:strand:- start:720 stop:875 length:156 start_codon:yes stop_codon:yes gene_type:complete